MADVLVNRSSFTLAAAITSATQTSITRTSAANGLPGDSNGPASATYKFVMTDGAGNFELARVTGGQGTTTLTIARAVELIGGVQTALASVPNGTVCYAVATAGDLALPSSYDTTVLTKLSLAPVAYWKLDEPAGSTTAADSSGNGYTLTVNGTVTFGEPSVVPADSETSAQGDGSTGYLSAATFPALVPVGNSLVTCIAAIKASASVAERGIVSWGSAANYEAWQFEGYNSGFMIGNYGGVSNVVFPVLDQQTLIGFSSDGATLMPFLNGRPVPSAGHVGVTENIQAANMVVGAIIGPSRYSNYPIGRVAIFAGVLTPKDWALLMQAFTGVA